MNKGTLWEMLCYNQQGLHPAEDLLRHSGTCHSVVPLRCEGAGYLLPPSLTDWELFEEPELSIISSLPCSLAKPVSVPRGRPQAERDAGA